MGDAMNLILNDKKDGKPLYKLSLQYFAMVSQ